MLRLFSDQMTFGEAVRWAAQAGYHLKQSEVADISFIRSPHLESALNRLPPFLEERLFGIDELRQTLHHHLSRPDGGWIIALDGIGGIGKTTLANVVTRQILQEEVFCSLAWVNAKQEEFFPSLGLRKYDRPALNEEMLIDALLEQLAEGHPLPLVPQERFRLLREILKQQPHLVVIDNLETVADYQSLLPLLRRLANPGKFLLTTRYSLAAHTDILNLTLRELPSKEAFALLRHLRGRQGFAPTSLTTEQLQSIYDVVGGNPLALKLIAGQMATLPLSQILGNLKEGESKKVEDLYTFIYWQSWQLLSHTARQVLLTMPLFSIQGVSFERLAQGSEVTPAALGDALEELALLSLVEVGGNVEHRRYRIHRLTETFLLNEVIQWQTS